MKLKDAVGLLESAGIENARGEAKILFEVLGGMKSYELLSPSSECNSDLLTEALRRRSEREPLQYIIGSVDFYREHYKVTPDCLIPRSDTEILVDYAVHNIPDGASFADLCTGSGCVAISTLKNTKNTHAYAYDISDAALNIARENAYINGVSERFSASAVDLMTDIPNIKEVFAVLSNPPYIKNSIYEELEAEIFHEPKCAFTGGEDGGDFYRRFVPIYRDIIADSGFMAFEIGYDQRYLMEELAKKHSLIIEIIKDFSGNDRVAVLKKRKKTT